MMVEKRLKVVLIIGIAILVLTTCTTQSQKQAVNTPVLPTTVPISTITPTPTITPRPSWTPRPTPTPTSTYIPYPSATPLSMLLLSREYIQYGFEHGWRYATTIYYNFIDTEGGTLYVVDNSYDLQSSCVIECTRQSWLNSPDTVIITMIRLQDDQAATLMAEELYNGLKPYHFEYVEEEYLAWVNAPTNNTHIGFSTWNGKLILTTSIGPIALKLEILMPQLDVTPIDILVAFANLQIYKLQQANVVPRVKNTAQPVSCQLEWHLTSTHSPRAKEKLRFS